MRNARLPIVALLAVALPFAASAATEVSRLESTLDRKTLGARDCGSRFLFRITATLNGQPVADIADRLDLSVASAKECTGGTAVNVRATAVAGSTGEYLFNLTGGQIFSAAFPGSTCPGDDEGQAKEVFLCAAFVNEGEGGETVRTSQPVDIDTVGPGRPRLTSVAPGDSALYLDFQPAEGSGSPANWEVCFQQIGQARSALADGEGGAGGDDGTGGTGAIGGDGGAGGAAGDEGEGGAGGIGGVGGSGGGGGAGGSGPIDFVEERCADLVNGAKRSYKLQGLRNHVTYQVAVRAVDDKNNRSPFSNVGQGTPVPSDGFWERYLDAGGEQQGCTSAAGAASGAGLALVALIFITISRKRAGR
ncbi:MAG TPA: hypothetical protein VN033_08995 [Vulgatibacter sp.]|nr:hypothetical protein [Vulgatibacter sp.]